MNRTRTLRAAALVAAVALLAAGCGDDDTASDATTPVATAVSAGVGTTLAGTTTVVAGSVAESGATVPEGSVAASGADSALATDCATIVSALSDLGSLDSVPAPSVGEEIDPATADAAQSIVETLDDLDVQDDSLHSALDDLKAAFQSIADGGTYTQELQDEVQATTAAVGQTCAPYFTS